jgi:hypothetical protein
MGVIEADCLFERSAKVVSEARIARTGCIGFLIQACSLIVYYLYICTISLAGVYLCFYSPPEWRVDNATIIYLTCHR